MANQWDYCRLNKRLAVSLSSIANGHSPCQNVDTLSKFRLKRLVPLGCLHVPEEIFSCGSVSSVHCSSHYSRDLNKVAGRHDSPLAALPKMASTHNRHSGT